MFCAGFFHTRKKFKNFSKEVIKSHLSFPIWCGKRDKHFSNHSGKGVRLMKPSDFQKTVQCRFESCLKKVVRHIVKDYQQGLKRRKDKEIPFCELPEIFVENFAVWDDYETDYTIFSVCGIDIRVLDDGLAEACAEYLSRKHKKPFFLVASYDNPHNICEYARRQNFPYGNIDIPDIRDCPGLPANFAKNPYDADVIESERINNYNVYPTAGFTPEDWRMYRYTYYRLVEKVDREIGKIIDAIDRNNLWENTVVIFSSDHGDGIGAHRWNQKSALYEEIINIPLIVTLPGKKNAGKVLPQLISNGVDFFASVCDWAGAKMPKGAAGKSFRKIAEEGNPQALHQEYIITETRFDGSKTRGWVVRSERYKYVLYDKGRYREQLFDMQNDRGEMRNLIMENSYGQKLQELRDILEKWMNIYNVRPSRPKLHDVPGKTLKNVHK